MKLYFLINSPTSSSWCMRVSSLPLCQHSIYLISGRVFYLLVGGYQKQASKVAGMVGKEGFPEQALHSHFLKLSAARTSRLDLSSSCRLQRSGVWWGPASSFPTASLWPCPHVAGKGATLPKVPSIRALIPFVWFLASGPDHCPKAHLLI